MCFTLNHKNNLRREILKARGEPKLYDNKYLANSVSEQIFEFLNKKYLLPLSIGLYYPMKGEIDLLNYLKDSKEWQKKNIKMSLPVIVNSDKMFFASYKFDDSLVSANINLNLYNPLFQPNSDIEEFPDIIILPALAFSCSGYRLGFGMGHYDKYFARLIKLGKKITTIGVISHENLFLSLPFDENDHRLNYIITDKLLIKI